MDTDNVKRADAGLVLSDAIRKFLHSIDVPNGIKAIGLGSKDIDGLVQGTLPQHRVTKMAPLPTGSEELQKLFEESMEIY